MTAASVIAVDTSEEALKLAVTLGADHAVRADGQQAQQVRDLAGSGADAVFDFVGEDSTIGDAVAMLRPGGTYYLVGYGGIVTLPASGFQPGRDHAGSHRKRRHDQAVVGDEGWRLDRGTGFRDSSQRQSGQIRPPVMRVCNTRALAV